MKTRLIAAGLALSVGIVILLTSLSGETGDCVPGGTQVCTATGRPSATIRPSDASGPSTPASSLPVDDPRRVATGDRDTGPVADRAAGLHLP